MTFYWPHKGNKLVFLQEVIKLIKIMRFYFDPKQPDVLKQLSIHMANAKFQYGFEYLGVQEKLVQTPLNDRYEDRMCDQLYIS